MTYTDEKVDLVINKMTQAQYEAAKQAGTLSPSELYITDETMPSKTSDLVNDSGFITASAIPSNVGAFTNDVGYLTASTMPPIPSQTSDLENNSGFITSSALSGYATENYVDGKVLALSSIYALDSDLDLVVASVSAIQTSLSTFATTSYVDAQIGAVLSESF